MIFFSIFLINGLHEISGKTPLPLHNASYMSEVLLDIISIVKYFYYELLNIV